MTYRVIVTARANAGAIEAFRFKAEHSTQAAARWLAGLVGGKGDGAEKGTEGIH